MADVMTKPKAPVGLLAGGKRLWVDTVGSWTLRVDELRVLEDACREADLIDQMQRKLRPATLMVKGSQGQDVVNPLVSEVRQHRAVLRGLLGQLRLTDDAASRSTAARAAANARWGSGPRSVA